jgi:hypothetical protein
MYNTTTLKTSYTLVDLFKVADGWVSGAFSILILVGVFIALFFILKRYATKSALMASSFVTLIVAMIFLAIQLISVGIFAIFLILLGFIVAFIYFSGDN